MFLGTRCGFGDVLWIPGGHFCCRNALDFWIDAFVGKAVREARVSLTHEGYMSGGCEEWDFVFPLLARE